MGTLRRTRGAALLLSLALWGCSSTTTGADLAPDQSPPADLSADQRSDLTPLVDAASADCLPRSDADLSALVMGQPFARRDGPDRMVIKPRDSAAWSAGRTAALAWAAADCPAFRAAAQQMGYQATDVRDTLTGRRHWVLSDASRSFNGVFVLRHPAERQRSRPLVVDSPHLGFDFTDDRAVRVYRELDGVAFLQNTAHRCNLSDCSGCSTVQSYPCGCERESDVVHGVNQLYFAVYDGLEAARDDLHLEYHGASASANAAGCAGTVHMSQASSQKRAAADDEGTYPNRFWRALEQRLGATCVCYHQRETGCLLNGFASTAGRRTNEEAGGGTVDECRAAGPGLAGRFIHLEWYNVDPADIIAALGQAAPLPL